MKDKASTNMTTKMNMMFRSMLAAAILAFATAGYCAGPITPVSPENGAVVPMLSDGQKAYFRMPRKERIAYFADKDCRKKMRALRWYPKATKLEWKGGEPDASYKVAVKRASDGKVAFSATTKKTSVKVENLEIATEYVWTVSGGGGELSAKFTTEDSAPRLLHIHGVPNFRDLGGRIGLGGRRVRQGMIYRSAGLNDNARKKQVTQDVPGKPGKTTEKTIRTPGKNRLDDPTRAYLTDTLGIKTEIDLRSDKECYGMTGSPMGEKVRWLHYSSSAYAGMQRDRGKKAFKKVFAVFLDEKNYPINFHCISGQDRTGSVAFILNGLLGVPEEELYLDWETTGFWNKSTDFCHSRRFNKLVDGFKEKVPGDSLHEKIENYVLALGFTKADIEKFRSMMLE